MKQLVVSFLGVTFVTYLLASLQADLCFLPVAAPALWVAVYCYVSFYRHIFTALVVNLIIASVLIQFSSVAAAPLLVSLNFLTFIAKMIHDRFQLTDGQIAFSVGPLTIGLNLSLLIFENGFGEIYLPDVWGWLGQGILTTILAPLVFFPMLKIDRYLRAQPTDHLELLLA